MQASLKSSSRSKELGLEKACDPRCKWIDATIKVKSRDFDLLKIKSEHVNIRIMLSRKEIDVSHNKYKYSASMTKNILHPYSLETLMNKLWLF